ncbi:TatD family hydrolase [Murdochiella vaginalis]|uniref:TatD family hydrolase n=1 Tax=Murdochiella vaginalis TaxID=1852373 RepID=UPI0008FE14EB|nr:TatD family hydrolase [Murdochiella vaginalis]
MTKRPDPSATTERPLSNAEPIGGNPASENKLWLIDAHCHLDDDAYDGTREDILASLEDEGVEAVVNPGCDEASSLQAVALALRYERVFACIGTHPHEASGYTSEWEARMRSLANEKKVVAIGEIGLDYHYDFSPRKTQRDVFECQLALAKELDLPVVIHSREACEDTLAILKNFGSSIRALMHSFNENPKIWQELADFGYFLSLGGMVTFKNARWPKELAQSVAGDRLLIETDGPYLAPVPYRGRLNLPWYAARTLETIAELRQESLPTLAKQVRQNTIAFFALPLGASAADSACCSTKSGKDGASSASRRGEKS